MTATIIIAPFPVRHRRTPHWATTDILATIDGNNRFFLADASMPEILPPARIRPDAERRALHLIWQDGRERFLPFRELRAACVCARCVDEVTGERLVFLEDISSDVRISEMNLAGNYALRVYWSDGHSTGLYTWARLDDLCFGPDALPEAE